jgi:hypothetical protein
MPPVSKNSKPTFVSVNDDTRGRVNWPRSRLAEEMQKLGESPQAQLSYGDLNVNVGPIACDHTNRYKWIAVV